MVIVALVVGIVGHAHLPGGRDLGPRAVPLLAERRQGYLEAEAHIQIERRAVGVEILRRETVQIRLAVISLMRGAEARLLIAAGLQARVVQYVGRAQVDVQIVLVIYPDGLAYGEIHRDAVQPSDELILLPDAADGDAE